MKNEEKLFKYLKEVSLPKIDAGQHKKYLKQKLRVEFKNFKPVSTYLNLPIAAYILTAFLSVISSSVWVF